MSVVTSWVTTEVSVSKYKIIDHVNDTDYSSGQVGRALGPLIFCTLYWWTGRETAYAMGAAGMVAVCGLVFGGLKVPPGTETTKKKVKA